MTAYILTIIIRLLPILGSNLIFAGFFMVVLNIYLDNLLLFRDFTLSLSYPKKIVRSTIPEEHLEGRENFRYKKFLVLMGANATGKTALGKVLMSVFNFISKKESAVITDLIEERNKTASFTLDVAGPEHVLYRISAVFSALEHVNDEYSSTDINVSVRSEKIGKQDSYNSCLKRLLAKENNEHKSYVMELEKLPPLSWKFEFPFASEGKQRAVHPYNKEIYSRFLEKTLKALDPRIMRVREVSEIEDAYAVMYPNRVEIIKNGLVMSPDKLSSGTLEGIGIADMLSAMKLKLCDFYYCDEKFSHIHSEVEKAFISLMIDYLGPNQQMIVTTHNSDVLDMDLPKNSYVFMRRNDFDETISCVYASYYLKKSTDSLKNAVENDLFSTAPNVDRIYDLSSL